MNRTVRAHFDGQVFVPDEPVDMPIGEPLKLEVCELNSATDLQKQSDIQKARREFVKWLEALPPIDPPLPSDYSAQHDHYLYGTPKRP